MSAHEEQCAQCGKLVSDEEYVVNWASCAECFGKHVNAYFNGPTPGPWAAQPIDMFGDVTVTGSEDSRAVAAVVSNMREPGQIIANARLIAAAPDMLEALEAICDALRDGDDFEAAQIAQHAGYAAITKAKGEQP